MSPPRTASNRVTGKSTKTRAGRQAAAEAKARRRRWIWGGTAAATTVVVGLILGLHATSSSTPSQPAAAGGQTAPDGQFTTVSGQTMSIASLRGKPMLLWFVSTWCSSCQAGTQAMAQNINQFQADGVRVVEVELYRDLGQSGPSIASFGQSLAGSQYSNPDWTFATSSASLTLAYDPKSYLDVYYLLDSRGRIAYVNGSPGSTMSSLLSEASRVA